MAINWSSSVFGMIDETFILCVFAQDLAQVNLELAPRAGDLLARDAVNESLLGTARFISIDTFPFVSFGNNADPSGETHSIQPG